MSLFSSTVHYTPISIAHGSEFLKELPLFKFYVKLESISTTPYKDHDECKSLNGFNELQKICYKLGDILGEITEISKLVDVDNNKNNDRSCQYLNYLIQEEIEKEKEKCDPNTLPSLYKALNKYKGSYGDYKCKFEQSNNTDTDIAKTSKNMYYYAEYLYWIIKEFKNIQDTKENIFSQFLNTSIRPYNKLLQHDTCNKPQKYKTQLEEFKNKYNEALEYIKKIYPVIITKPMNNYEEAKKTCGTDSEKTDELYPDLFKYFSTASSDLRAHPISQPLALSASGDILLDGTPQDSQGSTLGTATPIICSAVAISMFSFILHKFTPLGTYLRRNKLIDRNRMDEKQDDNYKLLSNASEIPHNIAYQPVGY
ncbi:VIR protein [Plasmodium vivax]|uniref:VIR protein n=1 Tax=Plasmodium vivax TaxID=5855 RepID=A0A1G4E3Y5_PLAVI|nr:VIR protein [Plasmodium vivax]